MKLAYPKLNKKWNYGRDYLGRWTFFTPPSIRNEVMRGIISIDEASLLKLRVSTIKGPSWLFGGRDEVNVTSWLDITDSNKFINK